jgi:uracil-DNA glycosylase
MMQIIVPGVGQQPNSVMVVGEAPDRREAEKGLPFVGASGEYQRQKFASHGVNINTAYRTNIVKLYLEGNPDPTPDLIREWEPTLFDEIFACDPLLIIAVGRFAAKWFLGPDTDMEIVHGTLRHSYVTGTPIPVLTTYHPAAALRAESGDRKDIISLYSWDVSQAANYINLLRRK